MVYIDIHTHKKSISKDVLSIKNVYPLDFNLDINLPCSLGIHPWYIDEKTYLQEIKIIEKNISRKNIVSVGEIGLDRNSPNFELQKEVFLHQAKIADNANKPIIIHCIKAYYDIISIIKTNKMSVPVIFHGFGGNKQIAEQLIKQGFYLSFGKILFNPDSKATKVFPKLPNKKIFFETDASNNNIIEIYKKAAQLKNIKLDKLKSLVFGSFTNIF